VRLLVLAAAALALPASARAGAPGAVVAAAEALATEVGAPPDGRRAILLAVEARSPALARLAEAALEGALAGRGYAVTPHHGAGDPESAARATRQEWLLRVRVGLVRGSRAGAGAPGGDPSSRGSSAGVSGGDALVLAGELVPTWASFFLQRRPAARAIPPRVVQARVAADAETRLVARERRPPGAPFATLRPLARLPGRVLALAVGDGGDGRTVIAAATPERLTVLLADGTPLAARDAGPGAATPVRDPAAALAVGDFGGGRIALRRAGAARGEVLALRGERLEPAGPLDAAPLCAGEAGALFGAFAPGTSVLEDLLAPRVDEAVRPRSGRRLYGVAAAPRGGPVAFAVLGTDLRLDLLGPDLASVPRAAPPDVLATGSGFALADLDGDGTAELVASSPTPDAPDRVRVLAPLARAPLLAELPVAGAVLAGAGGDVTGDGLDDAVLAAVSAGPDGRSETTLLLVTADAREVP
jgi:hypothetical protein